MSKIWRLSLLTIPFLTSLACTIGIAPRDQVLPNATPLSFAALNPTQAPEVEATLEQVDGPTELPATPTATMLPATLAPTATTEMPTPLPAIRSEQGLITYHSGEQGQENIMLLDPATGNSQQLTDTITSDISPKWSPEGSRLVFASDRDGDSDIYTYDITTNQIVNVSNNSVLDRDPVWHANGSAIIFSSEMDGNRELYQVNWDGSELIRLTDDLAYDIHPSIAPDGRTIVFASNRGGVDYDLYTLSLLSGETRLLLAAEGSDRYPVYHPDGSGVVFISNRTGNYELYFFEFATQLISQLTDNPAVDGAASFSRDGQSLVFDSNRTGQYELYRLNLETLAVTRLTNNGDVFDANPDWQP